MHQGVRIVEAVLDVWRNSLASQRQVQERTCFCVVDRNSEKFLASLGGFRTLIKYISASLTICSEWLGDLPKCCRSFCGWAFRAAFLVAILLVISRPVKLCTAGNTSQSEAPRRWNNQEMMAVKNLHRHHSNVLDNTHESYPYWRMDYGTICGLVLRRTTSPPPKLELEREPGRGWTQTDYNNSPTLIIKLDGGAVACPNFIRIRLQSHRDHSTMLQRLNAMQLLQSTAQGFRCDTNPTRRTCKLPSKSCNNKTLLGTTIRAAELILPLTRDTHKWWDGAAEADGLNYLLGHAMSQSLIQLIVPGRRTEQT